MNFLKGYRTLAFNGVTLLLLFLSMATGTVDNPDTIKILAGAQAVGNILLRLLTTTPVAKQSTDSGA